MDPEEQKTLLRMQKMEEGWRLARQVQEHCQKSALPLFNSSQTMEIIQEHLLKKTNQ